MAEVKTNREISRGILRRYMADYTKQRTAPKSAKGGFFAVLIGDTGEVWLGETSNFASVITNFHGKTTNTADCVKKAKQRGAELELWFLTQPLRFSAQELENELYEAELLASRKQIDKTGAGSLYVVRHNVTHAYFVLTNRQQGIAESTLLNNFYTRLVNMAGGSRNEKLNAFVTDQASDILNQRGFEIHFIDNFKDRDDEWAKRQAYIDNSRYGVNLNFKAVD
ncbi:hypothetical protein [Pseudomonas phage D6]|nr:hypothetical protein [Pseudomonas phage D6]